MRLSIIAFATLVAWTNVAWSQTSDASSRVQTLHLSRGFGQILQFDRPIDQFFLSNPEVADVEPVSDDSVYVYGVSTGETLLAAVDSAGQLVKSTKILVAVSSDLDNEAVRSLGLGEGVGVTYLGDVPVISGRVNSPSERRRVEQLRRSLDGDTAAADLTVFTGATQVLLQLRIAEVQTAGLRRTGLELDPDQDFGVLDALAQQGIAQILAEPSLLATDGTPARFVSGGEFAFDSGNEDTGVGFRQFGISLEFVPTILDGGRVLLEISSEISSPTPSAAAGSNAGSIPGRSIRSLNNTVELRNGETYAVAGLFQQTSDLDRSHVPLLHQVPILGNIFRTERFETTESELVILVTPKIVPRDSNPKPENAEETASQISDTVGFTLRPGLLK